MEMALVPSASTGSGGQLQVFASRLGLGDGVAILEAPLRDANLVLGAARGMEIKNEDLVKHPPDLQLLVYDAEEVLDEISYFRLQAELGEESLELEDHIKGDEAEEASSNALVPAFGGAIVCAAPRVELDQDELSLQMQ